jgi:hypothetical protein
MKVRQAKSFTFYKLNHKRIVSFKSSSEDRKNTCGFESVVEVLNSSTAEKYLSLGTPNRAKVYNTIGFLFKHNVQDFQPEQIFKALKMLSKIIESFASEPPNNVLTDFPSMWYIFGALMFRGIQSGYSTSQIIEKVGMNKAVINFIIQNSKMYA